MRSPHHMRASIVAVTLAAALVKAPDIAELIDAAEDEWRTARTVYRRGSFAGLRPITREQVAELGIPRRALRAWAGLAHDVVYVDRRCLKRYRRKAARHRK